MKCPLSKVIVAIDVGDKSEARRIADAVSKRCEFVKIGMQAFFGYGEDIIRYAKDKGLKVFLDLKLCDIPNTVSRGIRSLARFDFDLISVHICGGERMLYDANLALKESLPDAGIVGITILTSLSYTDLSAIGCTNKIEDIIVNMCKIAQKSNIYGIVCSAWDLDLLLPTHKKGLTIITPSIRMPGESSGDQKRVATPKEAFAKGADYIVMGRSIIRGDIIENLNKVEQHLI